MSPGREKEPIFDISDPASRLEQVSADIPRIGSTDVLVTYLSRLGKAAGIARDKGEEVLAKSIINLRQDVLIRALEMYSAGNSDISFEMRKIDTEKGKVDRLFFIIKHEYMSGQYECRTKIEELVAHPKIEPEMVRKLLEEERAFKNHVANSG